MGDPVGFGGQHGYYTDKETGLLYCTFRYYDPSTGRWLTRDPIGYAGGINLYAYVDNNPVVRADPSGLWWETGLDVAGLLYDLREYRNKPSFWNGAAIGGDILGIALPVLPSVGAVRLGGRVLSTVTRVAGNAAPALSQLQKKALRGQAVRLWENDRKVRASTIGLFVHHRIPLEYAHVMPGGAKYINRMSNLTGIDSTVHNNIHRLWTDFRVRYRRLGRVPTAKEVMEQVAEVDKVYGRFYK